mmetsp:Transcript_1552/g.4639  ORF Transcript_1552/g.4639 Transcript_1552/m.4639 type:complete len:278 (-) Transcript_1552:35-868(-)
MSRRALLEEMSFPRTDPRFPCLPGPSYPTYESFATSSQLARVRSTKESVGVKFDYSNETHREQLMRLWDVLCPDQDFPGPKSDAWKAVGFQSADPLSDLRAAGSLGVEHMVYLCENHREFVEGVMSRDWGYPFAASALNITYLLCGFLGLYDTPTRLYGATVEPPADTTLVAFLRLLQTDASALEDLYCEGVILMHEIWRQMQSQSTAVTLLDFPRAVMSSWHHLHRVLVRQPQSLEQLRVMLRQEPLIILSDPKDVDISVPWYKNACLMLCCCGRR